MAMVTAGRTGRKFVARPVRLDSSKPLTTGADSVMLARAAERNPSIFLPTGPRCNLTEIIPKLLSIADHISNPWGNTKFLLTQFKPSPSPISNMTKDQKKEAQEVVSRSKAIGEIASKLGVELGNGKAVMDEIEAKIGSRNMTVEPDIFEERREAERLGEVVEKPTIVDAKADVDGWEVGVGQAEIMHT